jgi:hypothetical protein
MAQNTNHCVKSGEKCEKCLLWKEVLVSDFPGFARRQAAIVFCLPLQPPFSCIQWVAGLARRYM